MKKSAGFHNIFPNQKSLIGSAKKQKKQKEGR